MAVETRKNMFDLAAADKRVISEIHRLIPSTGTVKDGT
jgi:hypothetical protein